MARKTQKYNAARTIATELNFRGDWDDQNALYQFLNEHHHVWDSKTGEWENYQAIPSYPPTDLLMIRVWTGTREESIAIARFLRHLLEQHTELDFIEQSEPYVCRPPKQNDYRVYLKFKKKPGQQLTELLDAVLGSSDNKK